MDFSRLNKWYNDVKKKVAARAERARDCIRMNNPKDALNHLHIADTFIILYERTLINEGIDPMVRDLRKQVVSAYHSIACSKGRVLR